MRTPEGCEANLDSCVSVPNFSKLLQKPDDVLRRDLAEDLGRTELAERRQGLSSDAFSGNERKRIGLARAAAVPASTIAAENQFVLMAFEDTPLRIPDCAPAHCGRMWPRDPRRGSEIHSTSGRSGRRASQGLWDKRRSLERRR